MASETFVTLVLYGFSFLSFSNISQLHILIVPLWVPHFLLWGFIGLYLLRKGLRFTAT